LQAVKDSEDSQASQVAEDQWVLQAVLVWTDLWVVKDSEDSQALQAAEVIWDSQAAEVKVDQDTLEA
jgi:hypothetical protein